MPGPAVLAPIQRLRNFHRELLGRDYSYARKAIERLTGGEWIQIADPFGNRLGFCEYDPP